MAVVSPTLGSELQGLHAAALCNFSNSAGQVESRPNLKPYELTSSRFKRRGQRSRSRTQLQEILRAVWTGGKAITTHESS